MATFNGGTVDQLKESAPLLVREKAIILVKSPYVILDEFPASTTSLTLLSDQYNWSEGVYNDLVQAVKAELQNVGISAERYMFCYF